MKNKVSPTSEENKFTIDQQKPEESSSLEIPDVKDTEESSSLGNSESAETTFDVVKQAIKLDKEDADDSSDKNRSDDKGDSDNLDKKGEEKSDLEDDSEDEDNLSEDELKHLKQKTRKRFEQLQSKYRTEKSERVKVEQERNQYKGFYDQYSNYLKNSGISSDEANELFDIGALMKSDPQRALEAITPYYNQLLEITGNVLSEDLRQQVSQGYMTERSAYELSRQRAVNNHHQNRVNVQRQNQQVENQRQQQELNSNIQTALANLERGWQKTDPDYKIKSTRIQERVKLKWYEASRNGQMPRSVEEAVKLAENVKKEVEKELRQFQPRRPINPVDGGGSSSTKPEPKTTLDVIKMAVGG